MIGIGSEMDYFIFESSIDPCKYLPAEEQKQYRSFQDALETAKVTNDDLELDASLRQEYGYGLESLIRRLELGIELLNKRAYQSYCESQKMLLKILSATAGADVDKKDFVTRGAAIKSTKRKGSF